MFIVWGSDLYKRLCQGYVEKNARAQCFRSPRTRLANVRVLVMRHCTDHFRLCLSTSIRFFFPSVDFWTWDHRGRSMDLLSPPRFDFYYTFFFPPVRLNLVITTFSTKVALFERKGSTIAWGERYKKCK